MDQSFFTYRELISSFLKTFLQQKEKEYLSNRWGKEIVENLTEFMMRGKMIRGSLVLFSFQTFSDAKIEDILPIAAAIELMHASLLIHDDIMDESFLRRGLPTINSYYDLFAKKNRFSNADNFGKNIATCIGDIGFFFAFELLSSLGGQNKKISEYISKEYALVGFAQVQDVYNGFVLDVTQNEILDIYKWKTGRYTFSLPLVVGAMLADRKGELVNKLEKFGEYLGILFQLKDDELDIFGDEKNMGKPVGSDIRENKKTLYWLNLFKKATSGQKQQLNKIFGSKKITRENLLYVQKLILDLEIDKQIKILMEDNADKAKAILMELDINKNQKQILLDLIKYSLAREK